MRQKFGSNSLYDKIKEKSIYAKVNNELPAIKQENVDYIVCDPSELILQGERLTRYQEEQNVRSACED